MKIKAFFDSTAATGVHVEIGKDDGLVEKKIISLDSFIKALEGSVEKVDCNIRIGKMPRGFYDGTIDPSKESSFSAIISVPQSNYVVQHAGDVYDIPFPALVFGFQVSEGKVTVSTCYAVKDEKITDSTELYYFPFSNVYPEGKICWGRNQIGEVNTIKDLERVIFMFYGAPSNNDLYSAGRNVKMDDMTLSLQGFYKLLDKQDVFPNDLLMQNGKKVRDIMNYISRH